MDIFLERKNDGNDLFRGIYNSLIITVIALIVIVTAVNAYRLFSREPEPEECLVLVDAPYGSEPDYRLGRDGECEAQ